MAKDVSIKINVDDKTLDNAKQKISLIKTDNNVQIKVDNTKAMSNIKALNTELGQNLNSVIGKVASSFSSLTGIKFDGMLSQAKQVKSIYSDLLNLANSLMGVKLNNLNNPNNVNTIVNGNGNGGPGFMGTALASTVGVKGFDATKAKLGDVLNQKKSELNQLRNQKNNLEQLKNSYNSMPIFGADGKPVSKEAGDAIINNFKKINELKFKNLNSEIKKTESTIAKTESQIQKLGKGGVTSLTALVNPAVVAGAAIGAIGIVATGAYLKIGKGFWDADKQIIKATGSLDDYKNSVSNMVNTSKYNIDDLASTFSKLAPSLSSDMILTNPTAPDAKGLEDLTIMVQRIKGLTGEQINERDISGMFNKWSISADNYKKTLDEVFYIHQQTGTSFSTIIQKVTQNKAIFDEMGWSVQQSTLAVAEWEKQGYDASTVAMAFKRAANVMVDDYGVQDLKAGFAQLQADLTGSKSRTEKLDEAAKFFGKRMSVDVVNAIIDGKIKLTEFTNIDFTKAEGSVDDTAKKVKTLGSAWQGVVNKLDVFVGKMLGSESAWKSFESWGIDALDSISKYFKDMSNEMDIFMKSDFWTYTKNALEPQVADALGIKQDKKKETKTKSSGIGDAVLNAATPHISKEGYDMNVAKRAYDVARARGVSDKVMLALFEAGIVESGMKNLNYGDADSLGFLQQRESQGWGDPSKTMNVEYATNSFLSEAIKKEKKYSTSGKLAQGVQRSAFPERYDNNESQAKKLLSQISGYDYTTSSGSSSSSNSDVDLSNSTAEKQKAASDNVQTLKEKWQLAQKFYEENKNDTTLQAVNAAYQTYANARDSFNQSWMKETELAKEQASAMVEDENQRWNIQKEYQQFAQDFVSIQKQKYDFANVKWESNKKDKNLKAMANEAYANYQSSRDSYNNTWLKGNDKIKASIEGQIEDQQRLNSLLNEQKNIMDNVVNSYKNLFKFSDVFQKQKIERFSPGKLERKSSKNFKNWTKWADNLAKLEAMGISQDTLYELRQLGVDGLGITDGLLKASADQRNKILSNVSGISNIALNQSAATFKHEVDGTIFVKSEAGDFALTKDQVQKLIDQALHIGTNRFVR